MKVFLTSAIAQILLTVYIFYRGYKVLPNKKAWTIPFLSLGCLELLIYGTAYFFYTIMPDEIFYFIQLICGSWFIASLYLFMMITSLDLLRLINHYLPFFPSFVLNNKTKTNYITFICCILLTPFILWSGYYNFTHPIVENIEIHIAKNAGDMKKVRIAFASDIHLGDMINKKEARQYVNLINKQHCDLVVLGGDQIDYDLHSITKNKLEEEFRKLDAPLGVYAILGNHEYRMNLDKKIEWMRSAGMIVLQDSSAMPGLSFYLVGRDDATNHDRKPLNYLLTGLDTSKPIIVADHQPVNIYEEVRSNTDLAIFGHVHDGQIWPHNYTVKLFWDGFSKGMRKIGNTNFFITSGLGLSGPPYRIGTHSEVVVFDIYFDGK